jgi:hypothetical protein
MPPAITPYRLAVPLIALFFIAYAWNCAFRGTKTLWQAILWTLFWGSVIVVVLFPAWISFLTAWTGIQEQENAIFAIFIGILLFIVFHILVRLERIQKRITDLVRHEALKEAGLGERKQTPEQAESGKL